MLRKNNFLFGAVLLAVSGIICKIIGAVYKIPLTNILGTSGMGLYYFVFPVYAFMLTLSSSAIPAAISRIISKNAAQNNYAEVHKIFVSSLLLMLILGGVFTGLLLILAAPLSKLQGTPQALIMYLAIAPAILLVSLVSGYRGYFQGLQNMVPSGVSQIIEQLAKLGFGFALAFLLLPQGLIYGVLGAILGITISEIFALVFLYIYYRVHKRHGHLTQEKFFYLSGPIIKKRMLPASMTTPSGYACHPSIEGNCSAGPSGKAGGGAGPPTSKLVGVKAPPLRCSKQFQFSTLSACGVRPSTKVGAGGTADDTASSLKETTHCAQIKARGLVTTPSGYACHPSIEGNLKGAKQVIKRPANCGSHILSGYLTETKQNGSTKVGAGGTAPAHYTPSPSGRGQGVGDNYWAYIKQIFITALPFMLGSAVFPLSLMLDSFLIVNLLTASGYNLDVSTTLFGINTGIISTLVSLPCVVSIALGLSVIPSVAYSNERGDKDAGLKKIAFAVKITGLFLLPCAFAFLFFAPQILNLLFSRGLAGGGFDQMEVSILLLQISSFTVLALGFLQIFTAILQSVNKAYIPVISLSIAIVLKIILEIILVSIPQINIAGAVLSNLVCFAAAAAVNYYFIKKYVPFKVSYAQAILVPVGASLIMAAVGWACIALFGLFMSENLSAVFALIIAACTYFGLLYALGVFGEDEKQLLTRLKNKRQ